MAGNARARVTTVPAITTAIATTAETAHWRFMSIVCSLKYEWWIRLLILLLMLVSTPGTEGATNYRFEI